MESRLDESMKLVQKELSLLKAKNTQDFSSANKFQEMLLKRLVGGSAKMRSQSTPTAGSFSLHTLPDQNQSSPSFLSNHIVVSDRFKPSYQPPTTNIENMDPEKNPPQIKKANPRPVLRHRPQNNQTPESSKSIPKVIHSPFRQPSTPVPKSKSSSSPSKKPLSDQDLQIKFYLPTSRTRVLENAELNNRNELQSDFVVPILNAKSGTRTGLMQKEKESEMEKMRKESDERLAIAVRKSIAKKKAREAEQKRKEEKEKSRYKKITSKIQTSIKSSKAVPNDKNQESPKKVSSQSQKSSTPKASQTNMKSSLSDLISNKMKSKVINHEKSDQEKMNRKPLQKAPSQKKPISESDGSLSSNPGKKPLYIPPSNRNTQPRPPPFGTSELVEKVIEALGSKLDPFLQSVQQHLERSAAEIDSKIEMKRVTSPIRVINATSPLAIDKESNLDYPAHEINQQTQGKSYLVKNELDHDDIAMILDMNEPSILYHDEISQNQPNTSGQLEMANNVINSEKETIQIHNDLLTNLRMNSPLASTLHEKEDPTDLHNVLVLADWIMEDIIQAKEMRRKWVNLYYGPNFDPAAVIGSISGEIMNAMIDNICAEVGDICGDYVNQIVEYEL